MLYRTARQGKRFTAWLERDNASAPLTDLFFDTLPKL